MDLQPDDEPIWLAAANTIISLMMACSFLFLIPWRHYYEHDLLWDDPTGMAAFFGVITVLNAFSLVVRARAVDVTNAKWTDTTNRYVSMTLSTLANTFFSGGLALWCVREDLHISRLICFTITVIGTVGHTLLFAKRWDLSKARGDGLITTIYGILSVVITLTFIFNQDLF
jgi:hypothetical protein